MTFIFAVLAIFFAINFAISKIGSKALLLYMQKKELTPPSGEELRACVQELLRRKVKGGRAEP